MLNSGPQKSGPPIEIMCFLQLSGLLAPYWMPTIKSMLRHQEYVTMLRVCYDVINLRVGCDCKSMLQC